MRARLAAWWGLVVSRRVQVEGLSLEVPAGVLDPRLFRTGAWFAARLAARVAPGQRVLDLGCGSGVVGVLAARAGAVVTAVDIDPRAVAAARRNGINDARLGDLFAAVPGERYDGIAFNPPYFPGSWTGRAYGRALYGGADLVVVRRFAREVVAHLAPGGWAWVAWSDRAPPAGPILGEAWREREADVVEGERLAIWERGA